MITEGPIDSLFLDNAIALAGADADGGITIQHQQCTMIYDNEPRNEHIVNRMISAVDKNFNVCIWPESVREGKDINDLIFQESPLVRFKVLYIIIHIAASPLFKTLIIGKGYK